MGEQVVQALAAGVDVVWWTDHDWRMSGHLYRQAFHFDALKELEIGYPWVLRPSTIGSPTAHSGGIVSSPSSPLDPHPAGALRLSATAASAATTWSSYGYTADDSGARYNGHGSLTGVTVRIEVRPESIGPDAYLELRVTTGVRPATGRRPRGNYVLSYRIGGPGRPGSRTRSGLTGVITLPAPVGSWTSLTLRPAVDVAALWPDIDTEDLSHQTVAFRASSRHGATAVGTWDYLRYDRASVSGDAALLQQQRVITRLATSYPALTQHHGVEISLYGGHQNWFGPTLHLPDYSGLPLLPGNDDVASARLVQQAHEVGGLVSLNHPFGTGEGPLLPDAQQEARRQALASALISNRALGCDLIEVAFPSRNGVSLARHVAVWDALSRNAIVLTGTDVNDNHGGGDWLTAPLRFLTMAWAPDRTMPTLLTALAAGRIYVADPVGFGGTLDLVIDTGATMGAVAVVTKQLTTLTVIATGLPGGSTVSVVQGVVDRAGPSQPDPITSVTQVHASAFVGGTFSLTLSTSSPSFVRVSVADATGAVVGLSNPIWMLRSLPAGIPAARLGIPAARLA